MRIPLVVLAVLLCAGGPKETKDEPEDMRRSTGETLNRVRVLSLTYSSGTGTRSLYQICPAMAVTFATGEKMGAGKEYEAEGRWPTEGDLLFINSERELADDIVRNPAERFYRMASGYKRAGDILMDQALADQSDRKNIVYAALFCYRQSIELLLKRLLETFGEADKGGTPKPTHDLSILWKGFIRLTEDLGGEDSIGLKEAGALVAEMHEADQRSDGFRYATQPNGKPFPF